MKKFFTLLIVLLMFLCLKNISAQNLVPNPSFEQYDTCPSVTGQINYAIPWLNPVYGTSPDYFNSCNTTDFNVPNNFAGYENARTGVAYTDVCLDVFCLFNPFFDNYREYVQIKLVSELSAGMKYCMKFFVSACDSNCYISNDIGVYFSQVEIRDTILSPLIPPLPYVPQIENSNNLNNRNGWTEITGEFTASGGEKYIIIGNFKDHNSTISTYTGWSPYVNWNFYALYYLDDVSLCRCDACLDSLNNIKMPNIFTPNEDHLNDLFIPNEKIDLRAGVLKIFNRWGLEIFHTGNIYSGWDGGNSPDGVYYWEIIYTDKMESNHREVGYVVLIR